MKYSTLSLPQYIEKLSSAHPVPGGGSAVATIGALAVSLSLMVARISMKKVDLTGKRKLAAVIKQLETIKKTCVNLIDRDPVVYEKVIKSFSLPKENKRRLQIIQRALTEAYQSMKEYCLVLDTIHRINKRVFSVSKGSIVGDLTISQACIDVAFRSAIKTAMLNVQCMNDLRIKQRLRKEIKQITNRYKKGL